MAILAQTHSEGTSGATVTAANWGVDFLTNNGAGTLVFDADAANGASSVKITQGTGAIFGEFASTTLGTTGLTDSYGAAYLKLSGYPSASNHILRGQSSGTAVTSWCIDVSSTGTIILRDSANTNVRTTTAVVPLNTWVRIEWHIVHTSSTTGTLQVQLYTVANGLTAAEDTGAVSSNYGANTGRVQVGVMNATPQVPVFRVDDFTISTTKTGPVGSAIVDPPTVNVGADIASQALTAGNVVRTVTATPATGGTLAGYQWSQVSGPTVVIDNATTATATIHPPATAGDVIIRCTVTQTSA